MSFIGAMGVVAQQGNQAVASAPTSVSIATGIGGGTYDNSFDTDDSDAALSALTFADAAPLNVGEDKEVRERKARWRREMSTKPGLMMN